MFCDAVWLNNDINGYFLLPMVKEIIEPLSPLPGQKERYDYQYERNGTLPTTVFS